MTGPVDADEPKEIVALRCARDRLHRVVDELWTLRCGAEDALSDVDRALWEWEQRVAGSVDSPGDKR